MMERSKELNDVTKVFPSAFRHVITDRKPSQTGFIGEVRANLKSKKDVILWIKTFGKNTNTKWIATAVKKKETKFIAAMDYVCYLCKSNADKIAVKKNCHAFVSFRVLAESTSSSSGDAYMTQGLFGIIKINYVHNHEINSTRILRSSSKVLPSFQNCEKGTNNKNIGKTSEDEDVEIETSSDDSEKCDNVPSCVYCNVSSEEDSERVFFNFPKHPKKCKKWLEACQGLDLIEKPVSDLASLRICSAHFVESDFVGPLKKRLKIDACPSLFIEKSFKHEKLPHEKASINSKDDVAENKFNGSKLSKMDSCYEGFASYDSSSEGSDYEDEVPLDTSFGFEKSIPADCRIELYTSGYLDEELVTRAFSEDDMISCDVIDMSRLLNVLT